MLWAKVIFKKSKAPAGNEECTRCDHRWMTGDVAYKKSFPSSSSGGYTVEFVCKKCAERSNLIPNLLHKIWGEK
tara:strand:+ start:790 stop:1011 length:222 start_codon:yes stop_codon:yes gene_type:complete